MKDKGDLRGGQLTNRLHLALTPTQGTRGSVDVMEPRMGTQEGEREGEERETLYGHPHSTTVPTSHLPHEHTRVPLSAVVLTVAVLLLILIVFLIGFEGTTEAFAWFFVVLSCTVIASGLELCFVTDVADSNPKREHWVSLRTCGLVTLFIFALVSIATMAFLLTAGGLTSPYRAQFDTVGSVPHNTAMGRLENGLRYVIVPNKWEEKKFSLRLRVEAGSWDERDDQLGLAHFCEHMSFDNTVGHPGRGAIFSEMLREGAEFNAFTDFRSTVYFMNRVDFSHDTLKKALFTQRQQVFHQAPLDAFVDLEKGAVLGEERFRNDSSDIAYKNLICNHFGKDSRTCNRFPIGTKPMIQGFTAAGVQDFYDTWYRLDRMTLIVVGDFVPEEVEVLIQETWGTEVPREGQRGGAPAHPSMEPPRPSQSVLVQEIDGFDGVEFDLLVTRPYVPHPYSYKMYRQETLDKLFSIHYQTQVASRLADTYADLGDVDFELVVAGVNVENDYSMNVTQHALSISTTTDPNRGEWRTAWTIGLAELRRLARNGPDPAFVSALMQLADSSFHVQRQMSGSVESDTLASLILGNLDPRYVFKNSDQLYDIQSQFLDEGFVDAATKYIHSQAQFLWKALVELYTSKPFNSPPFHMLESPVASLNVFVGKQERNQIFSHINEKSVLDVIRQVHTGRPPHAASVGDDAVDRKKFNEAELPTEPIDTLLAGRRSPVPADSGDDDDDDDKHRDLSGIMEIVPISGSFIDRTRLNPAGEPSLVVSHPTTEVMQFKLANGIPVNMKVTKSGDDKMPRGPPGRLLLEIVALGGRATETRELKGACEFVSSSHPSGFSVEYFTEGNTIERTDYVSETVLSVLTPPSILCQEESLVLRVKLGKDYPTFPRVPSSCDSMNATYFKKLEGLRLALNPMFNDRDRDVVARELAERERALFATNDPQSYVDFHGEGSLFEQAWRGDVRVQRVTPEHILALDPLRVQRWVREHFEVGRFEVNVAGDMDLLNVLKQLNTMLGTMPNITYTDTPVLGDSEKPRATRVGLSPFSQTDVSQFVRVFPSETHSMRCNVESGFPGRGYTLLYLPSFDAFRIRNTALGLFTDQLIEQMMFEALRKRKGFCYGADVQTYHSTLLKEFGYVRLSWIAGPNATDPTSFLDAPTNGSDTMVLTNIARSVSDAWSTLDTRVPRDIFDVIKNQVLSQTRADMQAPGFWLRAMRGLGIPAPFSWDVPKGTTLKTLNATDVITRLEEIKYEGINDLLPTTHYGEAYMDFAVETRKRSGVIVQGRNAFRCRILG